MKNAANKVWNWSKGLNVSIAGKINVGFIEITVTPR